MGANIGPLGGTEILRDLLNIGPDLAYQAWVNCYDEQVVSKKLGPNDDLEVTVLTTSLSLPLNMDPWEADAWPVQALPDAAGKTLCYRPCPCLWQSASFRFTVEESTDLQTWTPAEFSRIIEQPHGW